MKAQESNSLRQENQALMHENERYRGLIETLLRHPAFTPFINDISKDPSVLMPPQLQQHRQQQQQQQQQTSVAPTPQPQQAQPQQQSQADMKPEFLNFDASQLQVPSQSQSEQQQIGLAMIPENDFSKLKLNNFNSMNFKSMNFNNNQNYNGVNAYVVQDLPTGPDPVDLLIESPTRLPYSTAASTDYFSAAHAPVDSGLTVLLAKLDNAARKVDVNQSLY